MQTRIGRLRLLSESWHASLSNLIVSSPLDLLSCRAMGDLLGCDIDLDDLDEVLEYKEEEGASREHEAHRFERTQGQAKCVYGPCLLPCQANPVDRFDSRVQPAHSI